MSSIQSENRSVKRLSTRSVALPAEHGSWSLVSEPILLGLLVAPSLGGLALAIGAFALFLFNRPFKIYWTDRRRDRAYERTVVALRYATIYGIVAALGFGGGLALAGWQAFVPLALAAPLLALFMVYDQRPGRYWQAELAAPVAFAAIVASMAVAGGWEWVPALALWGFMAARAMPAVLFIRARLRLDKGKVTGPGESAPVVMAVHTLALAVVIGLVLPGWLPATAVLAATLLLARAGWGLSAWRWRSSVKALGILETIIGLLVVLLVAAGYWF